MKTVNQLNAIREELKRRLADMSPVHQRFLETEKQTRADATRHPDYIAERVNAARDVALGAVGKTRGEMSALNQTLQGEIAYWRQTQFVLSRQQFHPNQPELESVTRSRHFSELSAMPSQLRKMVFDDAKRQGNLPLVFQCYLADAKDGTRAIDLTDIKIPEQEQALEIIAQCAAIPAEADHLIAGISGRRVANTLDQARARSVQPLTPTTRFANEQATPEQQHVDPVNLAEGTPQDRMTATRASTA
jgi:hypothetical protein